MFFCEETERRDKADPFPLYELGEQAKAAISSVEEDKLDQLLDELLHRARSEGHPLQDLLLVLRRIHNALRKAAKNSDINFEETDDNDLLPEGVGSLSDYVRYLRETGSQLFAMLRYRNESRNQEYVKLAEEYVRSKIADNNITLNVVAEALGMSPEHLSRMFKRIAGINFASFLTGEKLRYARSLLLTTDERVQDIAIRCGYSNAQYFISKFKKAYGITPNEYRKRYIRAKIAETFTEADTMDAR